MQKREILSFLLGSALAVSLLTGCQSDDNNDDSVETVSPYERVAEISGDWATDVPAIAAAIANYVDQTEENTTLGYPTNWIVGGDLNATGESGIEAVDRMLGIPKIYDGVTNKIKVIELCNKAYATQATGTGRFHGPALPCEVAVHSDGTKVYVDILNPEAIFTLFFADLSDEEKTSLKTVAETVKTEIKGMITAALESTAYSFNSLSTAMGPSFKTTGDLGGAAYIDPYIVYNYTDPAVTTFTNTDAKNLAIKIIEMLGDDATPSQVDGISSGSSWRSARPYPLPIPNVQIVEACSPTYAKKATALGAQYATALPCEIGVMVDEDNASVLKVSFLNPTFMFNIMFADAFSSISESDRLEYSTLPDVVFSDLRLIVQAAIDDIATNAVNGSTYDLSISK